jgi:A/G-specific adenine glycosylase
MSSTKTPRDEKVTKDLLAWYRRSHRDLPWRRTGDAYRIWVSEVMLQQTQVATVIPFYERFVARFPDLASLAQAPLDDVLKLWEGLGYYARARNLHAAAREVVDRFAGVVPRDAQEFRTLPGVGEYIGAAVPSIAFGVPAVVVDGNVKRVIARLFAFAESVDRPAGTPRSRREARRRFRAAIRGGRFPCSASPWEWCGATAACSSRVALSLACSAGCGSSPGARSGPANCPRRRAAARSARR